MEEIKKTNETLDKIKTASEIVLGITGFACGILGVYVASKAYKKGFDAGMGAGVHGTLGQIIQAGPDGWTVEGQASIEGNNWKYTATKL